MIVRYKYGFEYKGKIYGWNNKRLYRLPCVLSNRSFGLLECKPWKDGFYLGSDRKSLSQLKAMTHYIDKELEVITSEDCPF